MVHRCRHRIIGCLLGILLLALIISPLAAENPTVTITVSAWVVGTPSGLILTLVNGNALDIQWTKGINANNTMIRAKYGTVPADRTDGYLVYYGTGNECVDNGMDFDSPFTIYYRLWSQNTAGTWEITGTSGWMEAPVLTLIALFLFCGILSFLAIRSSFGLLKFLAGIGWIAMFIYWMTNPPSTVTPGSPAHVAVMLVLITAAVAISLLGLGRDIRTQEDWRKGLTVSGSKTASGFQFKVPDWMKSARGESPQEIRHRREEETEEYRERIYRALHPPRREKG